MGGCRNSAPEQDSIIDTTPETSDVVQRFRPLFEPSSVAVVGASAKGGARGNVLIRRIRAFGYKGPIFPIHPVAREIDGLPVYASFADLPSIVDYAYIAIPGRDVIPLLAKANGRVRFAQVISSGFSESAGGAALETELVKAARQGGMRLIGPNCVGIFSPRGGITWTEIAPQPAGTVGVLSQSGGLGVDIVRRGSNRGLAFSGLVTLGNCADLGLSDLVEYFLAHAETKVIGLYVESARDGRRLFDLLRAARGRKPVVILKGGRTPEGKVAATSHTGALGGGDRAWQALSRQTGSILVKSVEELIDTLLAFQMLTPGTARPTQRVVLFGNGGGTSVLATDYLSEHGLTVAPFSADTRRALEAIELLPGSSINNPVDIPGGNFRKNGGAAASGILEAIYRLEQPDALIMHLNMTAFKGYGNNDTLDTLVQAALRVKTSCPSHSHFVMALRSDGNPALEEQKRLFRLRAAASGIPVYDELNNAGNALAAMSQFERFVCSRSAQG
ncbi:MAG: CoA-binding protein [Burkholderiales bacterium]|nr:CoA-binding protein [Burkholderiales bacterium]